jgi:hypothetical protein
MLTLHWARQVLVISLFGPRHGRLLQARFTKSGILKVRASAIHSFEKRDNALSDLYLRYLACEPKGGEEFEFYSDEDEDTSTQVAARQAPTPIAHRPSLPVRFVH